MGGREISFRRGAGATAVTIVGALMRLWASARIFSKAWAQDNERQIGVMAMKLSRLGFLMLGLAVAISAQAGQPSGHPSAPTPPSADQALPPTIDLDCVDQSPAPGKPVPFIEGQELFEG